MRDSSYIIRNYSPDDFGKYMEFFNSMDMFLPDEWKSVTQLFQKKMDKPGYSPEQHLLLAEWKGKIIGCADMSPEPKIGRVILNGLISVRHRGKGLAGEMMESILERAEKLGFKIAHVCVSEDNAAARGLLSKSSFSVVRQFHGLEIGLQGLPDDKFDLSSQEIISLKPGEEALLAKIQNRCFTGTWGFCPNTTEEIIYYLNLTESRLKDVIVAKGEKRIVGYCWMHLIGDRGQRDVQKKGRIHMLGVDPDYRRRGIGKNLLKAGLYHLKKRGVEMAELTADKENADALAIYHSLGFRKKSTSLWYEKKGTPPTNKCCLAEKKIL